MKRLFVSNLPYHATETSLKDLFSPLGNVQQVHIVLDRVSGKSKGFGFVEFSSEKEAQDAILSLNGKMFEGRPLVVAEAREKKIRQ